MIVKNANRDTVIGAAIEVASTSAQKAKGLLGRDCLADGEGLMFKGCSSLHTFFMQFAIDIIFADKSLKVLKTAKAVKPFKLVAAPLRAYYAIELPVGAIEGSDTKPGDHLAFLEEPLTPGLSVARSA